MELEARVIHGDIIIVFSLITYQQEQLRSSFAPASATV